MLTVLHPFAVISLGSCGILDGSRPQSNCRIYAYICEEISVCLAEVKGLADIILDREKGMDYVRRALSAGPDHIIHFLFRMSSKIIKIPHPEMDAEKKFSPNPTKILCCLYFAVGN